MKRTAKISTSAAMAGLGLAVLGLMLSGGFGPCGPQHPGPFFVAVLGASGFALGMLGLSVGLIALLSRKLMTFARSHKS
jgi:hypothetical protein